MEIGGASSNGGNLGIKVIRKKKSGIFAGFKRIWEKLVAGGKNVRDAKSKGK